MRRRLALGRWWRFVRLALFAVALAVLLLHAGIAYILTRPAQSGPYPNTPADLGLDYEDVMLVTGDHSTPAVLRSHSWHPVPVVLWSAYCRPDRVERFGERACIGGGLGPRIPATELVPLALANALRLHKYGA